MGRVGRGVWRLRYPTQMIVAVVVIVMNLSSSLSCHWMRGPWSSFMERNQGGEPECQPLTTPGFPRTVSETRMQVFAGEVGVTHTRGRGGTAVCEHGRGCKRDLPPPSANAVLDWAGIW